MTLQQQWDIWLCASVAKYPDAQIWDSIKRFAVAMKMTPQEVKDAELKRFPHGFLPCRSRISRFVCGYLIGGADVIYGEGNTIQKAMKLAKCEFTPVPVDKAKVREETAEKNQTKRAARLAQSELELGNKQRDAYGRRNWSACK
jgi:hypothetical protein